MPVSALPDVVPLALAGTSFAVLGGLILTGSSGIVPPLVES